MSHRKWKLRKPCPRRLSIGSISSSQGFLKHAMGKAKPGSLSSPCSLRLFSKLGHFCKGSPAGSPGGWEAAIVGCRVPFCSNSSQMGGVFSLQEKSPNLWPGPLSRSLFWQQIWWKWAILLARTFHTWSPGLPGLSSGSWNVLLEQPQSITLASSP